MKTHDIYREFTFGWLLLAFMIPTYSMMVYLFVNDLGDRPFTPGAFLLTTISMALACLMFYGMTTIVTDDAVTVSFGIGLIRKRIFLQRIMTLRIVKSPWYYGRGIRFIPNGRMYNISGNQAVELTFNDSDRVFWIGTRNPKELIDAIENQIQSKR
jgi:hypothetical protein